MPDTSKIIFADLTLPPTRRNTQQAYASLRTIVSSGFDTNDTRNLTEQNGQIAISFPAMPEVLDFARQASFISNVNQANPDGIPIYKETSQLSLRVAFSLHAYDRDYTLEAGPVTLLAMAARLHAIAMPIYTQGQTPTTATAAPSVSQDKRNDESTQAQSGDTQATGQTKIANYLFPAACVLRLIDARYTPANGVSYDYGVNMRGYVTDVSVKLRGPWLQGGPTLVNLPTSADYEFTFVHSPAYSGNTSTNLVPNLSTMAQDIYTRFYSQQDISKIMAYGDNLAASGKQYGYSDMNVQPIEYKGLAG